MNAIESAYVRFSATRFPLPSKQQIAALEKRIGGPLPPDYRRFILNYNGGYFTEPDIVPPAEQCPVDGLTVLYGIGATHHSAELARPASLALFEDNDPVEILPIGYTLMGNLLYLITHSEDAGFIGLKRASSDQCFFLAAEIEEFFGLLREPSDE